MTKAMKQKQLEIKLQQHVRPFVKPKVELEQYHTPAVIAATVVHCMYSAGDVEGLRVCDLGCGTGMLSIACALMGASAVVGVDVDEEALAVMAENLAAVEDDLSIKVETISADVVGYEGECDVVVTNPPFGTRAKGADMAFLTTAASIGRVIYSMHKTSTRKHVEKAAAALGLEGRAIAQLRYNLDKTHDFHKKKSVDIEVDLWRLERVAK